MFLSMQLPSKFVLCNEWFGTQLLQNGTMVSSIMVTRELMTIINGYVFCPVA